MKQPPYRVTALHAPNDDDESDLANVPRDYVHARCRGVTHTSAVSMRRLHRIPMSMPYNGNRTLCAACKMKDFPAEEFTWIETGENVRDYFHAVQAEALRTAPNVWIGPAIRTALIYAVAVAVVGCLAAAFVGIKIKGGDPGYSFGLFLGSLLLALVVGPAIMIQKFVVKRRRLQAYSDRFGVDDNPR